jgi:hypothetical protein
MVTDQEIIASDLAPGGGAAADKALSMTYGLVSPVLIRAISS